MLQICEITNNNRNRALETQLTKISIFRVEKNWPNLIQGCDNQVLKGMDQYRIKKYISGEHIVCIPKEEVAQ